MSNLVSTDWLASRLGNAHVVILDASWHMPGTKRNAHAEFLEGHIPGAQFFDLDKTSDQNTSLPHMLPSAEDFAKAVAALGVSNESHVVVYDSVGLFSAARCWWMFKTFGHKSVSVLDGGLKRWRAEGRPLAAGAPPAPAPTIFTAKFKPSRVQTMADVAKTHAQIVDARSPARFRGEEAEPRPGVKPGHMPGARNVHYASLLTDTGELLPPDILRQRFTEAGVNLAKPIITSCGSGVTAAILSLALTQLGLADHALYDGSWAEWGASNNPIVTGA